MEEKIEIDKDVELIISKKAYHKILKRIDYLIKEISFWQGKFNILRTENNALRKQMKGLISMEEAIEKIVEMDKKILADYDPPVSEEAIRNHYSRILK